MDNGNYLLNTGANKRRKYNRQVKNKKAYSTSEVFLLLVLFGIQEQGNRQENAWCDVTQL